MIKSIQFRKKSRLLDLIDQIEWWDAQGMLFAKGHVLGGLLQDLDIYKKCGQQYSFPFLDFLLSPLLNLIYWFSQSFQPSLQPEITHFPPGSTNDL